MMSRHFRLRSEFSGAIAKRLPHTKNQLSVPGIDCDILENLVSCMPNRIEKVLELKVYYIGE